MTGSRGLWHGWARGTEKGAASLRPYAEVTP